MLEWLQIKGAFGPDGVGPDAVMTGANGTLVNFKNRVVLGRRLQKVWQLK